MKDAIRKAVSARRREVSYGSRGTASASICERILAREDVRSAMAARDAFALYIASSDEISLNRLMLELWAAGCEVSVPAWNGETYVMARCDADMRLVAGPHGILQPERIERPREAAVWIVPGLAFTADGGRLGYGGGWYDRFLRTAKVGAVSIGVGYDFQMMDELPLEAHDVRLTAVITEAANLNAQTLSIVIPCYNEEACIGKLAAEILAAQPVGECELIFVDDGSTDGTLGVLNGMSAKDGRIRCLHLAKHHGKEFALVAGLRKADGRWVATMDADGQDPAAVLPQMVESLAGGECDCVIARRVNRTGEALVRSLAARLFRRIMHMVTGIELASGERDYRMFSGEKLKKVLSVLEAVRFYKGSFHLLPMRMKWIEYENLPRVSGKSKWSMVGLVGYAVTALVNMRRYGNAKKA